MILSCYMIHASEANLYKSPMDMEARKCLFRSYCTYSTWLTSPSKFLYNNFGSVPQGYILNVLLASCLLMTTLFIIRKGYKRIFAAKQKESCESKLTFSTNFERDTNLVTDENDQVINEDVEKRLHSMQSFHNVRLPKTFFCMKTALNTEAKLDAQLDCRLNFDVDEVPFVLDNAANVHIINDIALFDNNEVKPINEYSVATIGNEAQVPEGVNHATLKAKTNDGIYATLPLENALFFPNSPVNIISIARLSDTLGDDFDTWIKTARHHSDFTWDHGKHHRTIYHSDSRIPEIGVTTSIDNWKSFCSISSLLQPGVF